MITENSSLTTGNAAIRASEYIKTIPAYPEDRFAGRGIVICAGGVRYLTNAWVLINILREHGCTLPIEVWYLGEDEGDSQWIELVRPLGVECIDARVTAKRHPHPRLIGWELKPYAILHSRFQEVLFLDADNVPVVDPSYLLDSPEFQRDGALFWPDPEHFRTHLDSVRWALFGVEYRDEPDMESGQLVIDKRRCWQALSLCDWYNKRSDFYYQHVYGDKDTFRFAWHATHTTYAMPSRYAEDRPWTLNQHSFDGNLLFQHRFGDKWSLEGNMRIPSFEYERECLALVEELRSQWSPDEHFTRHLNANDREQMRQLSGHTINYSRVGMNSWQMRLGQNGRVDEDWTHEIFYWWCDDGQLVFAGVDGKSASVLHSVSQSQWKGASMHHPERIIHAEISPIRELIPA